MDSEDLAAALAAHFNDLDDKPLAYQAAALDDIEETKKETSDWKVLVVPYNESDEAVSLSGGMVRAELTCSVVVSGPIKPNSKRKTGLQLSRFLRRSLCETEIDGFAWNDNETVSLYDTEALRKKQFLSLFRATFFNFE